VISLAVPEIVVQGFAALVMVLVTAGVVAVLTLGSRARVPKVPPRRPARLPAGTSAFAVGVDSMHRNGRH
jgi:hypothetical protein